MVFWRGKEIEEYTKDELEQEISNIYDIVDEMKWREIGHLSSKYRINRKWRLFNEIALLAATNLEDYIRTKKIFPEFEEIKTVYKRKYFVE